jgi:hypothetical protein
LSFAVPGTELTHPTNFDRKDLMADGVVANLEAAVLLVHGFDFRHLVGRRGFEIAFDVGVKGWLVVPRGYGLAGASGRD